jgi:hypothetical protein
MGRYSMVKPTTSSRLDVGFVVTAFMASAGMALNAAGRLTAEASNGNNGSCAYCNDEVFEVTRQARLDGSSIASRSSAGQLASSGARGVGDAWLPNTVHPCITNSCLSVTGLCQSSIPPIGEWNMS